MLCLPRWLAAPALPRELLAPDIAVPLLPPCCMPGEGRFIWEG
jgi:hypothetical protein